LLLWTCELMSAVCLPGDSSQSLFLWQKVMSSWLPLSLDSV
jgi:hypothetical protein